MINVNISCYIMFFLLCPNLNSEPPIYNLLAQTNRDTQNPPKRIWS